MTTPTEPEPAPGRPEQLARLQQTAVTLVEGIESLAEDSGQQFVSLARKALINRRMIWALAVLAALSVGLAAVLAVVVDGVAANNRRIDNLTQRLDVSQTTTRKNSLCPLYTLLKDSETPAAREAAPDKAAYDHAVIVIRDGYAALHCSDFVSTAPVPGPTSG